MIVKKLFLRNQALLGMPAVIRRALCLLVLVLLGLGPSTQPHHGNAAAGQGGASFLLLPTAAAAADSDAKEIPMIVSTNDAMNEKEDALALVPEGTSSLVANNVVLGGVKATTTLMTTTTTATTRLGGHRKERDAGAGGDPVLLRDLDGGGTHSDDAGSGRSSKVEEVSTDHDHHERGNCSLFLFVFLFTDDN